MKIKEFVVLTVVIVILGTYLFLRNSDRARYELPALSNVSAEDVSRMEITSSGEIVPLYRDGDQWRVGEARYPADKTKVKNMLTALEDLALTALVSEAGAYARYDLTDNKKITVKSWVDDELVRNLDIGKEADTYQHTFVRIEDNPNVYHARSSFRRTFDQTIEGLRDKTVLSFETADIREIEVSAPGGEMTLAMSEEPAEIDTPGETAAEEKEAVWLTGDGSPADTNAIQRLLSQLAYLTCSGYLDNEDKSAFENPEYTVILKNGGTHMLSLFEKEDMDISYPAVSSQNDYTFTLSESAWSRLTEILESFFNKEPDEQTAS